MSKTKLIEITAGGIFGAKGEHAIGTRFEVPADANLDGWRGRYREVGPGTTNDQITGDNQGANSDQGGNGNQQPLTAEQIEAKRLADEEAAKNAGGGNTTKKYDAKHKGGPVWHIVETADESKVVRASIAKADATAFDALKTTEEQEAWLTAHPAPAA